MSTDTIDASARKLHAEILAALDSSPKAKSPTVVTIYSMHDGEGGQWVIGDPDQDPARVAARLRLCADIIEKRAPFTEDNWP